MRRTDCLDLVLSAAARENAAIPSEGSGGSTGGLATIVPGRDLSLGFRWTGQADLATAKNRLPVVFGFLPDSPGVRSFSPLQVHLGSFVAPSRAISALASMRAAAGTRQAWLFLSPQTGAVSDNVERIECVMR